MQKVIISDTSCLVLLTKIGELQLLKSLFGEIIITSVIATEYGEVLPDWIIVKDAENENYASLLSVTVDLGEASAIALAVENKTSLLILDDNKARILAGSLGLKYTGTLGILIDAKKQGHLQSIKPALEKVKKTDFRLTEELIKKAMTLAGE